MKQIPFDRLMNWLMDEYKERGEIFGIKNISRASSPSKPFLGPAAGPHTQLAQNIIAAYVAGGRFFELKTVQVLDGEDLPIVKPCIAVPDEGYNVEWSTELYVPQAMDEYIKAWVALSILKQELSLGNFMFNMSVGYDLKGIQTEKIDNFIEGLKNAENTESWEICLDWVKKNKPEYTNKISPYICDSITLSTLHGCPPDEIERISSYLICEKKLNTFVKCNPTLLGYEYTRSTLDNLGFDYLKFDDHHFKADLQFEDAVPMIGRLRELTASKSLIFGVKLSNTFPVEITDELPGEEMYMSGRALYPLTMALCKKLSDAFDGQLRISFSGGADAHNIAQLLETGIWPITVATTLLKPGGYERLGQMAELLNIDTPPKVDTQKLQALLDDLAKNPLYRKSIKAKPIRKLKDKAPLLDCSIAACREGCPLAQDIPKYLKLAGEGKYTEAFQVITERNPMPFTTGTICPQHCRDSCTRNFYEEAINIRSVKLEVAEKALLASSPTAKSGDKIAIIGGGPAGLAAAYFLAKAGRPVTIFEKRDSLGGIVRHVIPEFRISSKALDKDIEFILSTGIEVKLNSEIKNQEELAEYSEIIVATGAWKPGILKLQKGLALNALEFLEGIKKNPASAKLGETVIVIGGGNTAMDAARAAKRISGVKKVSIVYRRNKRYMPADEEEFCAVLADGIEFHELLSPISFENGELLCEKVQLNEEHKPVPTGEQQTIQADSIIAAIGDSAEGHNFKNAYVIGDAHLGPSTVVEAIADAITCVQNILQKEIGGAQSANLSPTKAKKGYLCFSSESTHEANRCLHCNTICGNCVDVCPNRANVLVMGQIIHMDALCNECGNCEMFCPYSGAPYKDKLTYYSDTNSFSDNSSETEKLRQAALACDRIQIMIV